MHAADRPMTRVVVGASVFALALTVALPHQHVPTSAAQETSACPLWQIHVGFSAALPAIDAGVAPLTWVAVQAIHAPAPRPSRLAVRLHAPRAPPVSS